MLGIIGRNWRGEMGFWTSLLLFSVALPAFLFWFIPYTQAILELEATPNIRIVVAVTMVTLFGAIGFWQLGGTWRASSKARAPGHWLVLRWFARLVALAAAAVSLIFVGIMPRGMAHLRAIATDTDKIGKMGYTLSVDGDNLIATGAVTWGLHDAFIKVVADNPNLKTVVLNGPGGHVAVGLRLAALIKERQLDTMTTQMCASTCTMMFGAGKRRLLRNGAKLGFHAETPTFTADNGGPNPVLRMTEERTKAFWRDAGVPDDFVAHIFATPGESLWTPTNSELLKAKIITEVVK